MRNRKTFRTFALLALVICLAALTFCLVSCTETIDDMYIASSNAPRRTYVQGQDLDLSKGALTVVTGDGDVLIPLNSEEVSVSGYEKDKLGEQTVTFTYKELSATLTVNVIPRISAEGYEANYFVKDEFNKNVGRIVVASDDATTFTVNMNDSRVQLVSFDSDKAGKAVVTVKYTDGGVSYNCQFEVTVHEYASITFTPPTKKGYESHESAGLDLKGGYFTVTSKDGTLEKDVKLTEDMIKGGFNLSAATMSNRYTPLNQTISVEYLTKKDSYDIKIIFSNVSVVNYYGNGILADIDWTADPNPESVMTKAEEEAAIDATKAYYNLNDDLKDLISDEVKDVVVHAGVVAISRQFDLELEAFSHVFAIDEENNLYLTAEEYQPVADSLEEIKDDDAAINVLAELLISLKEEFKDVSITADKTVGEYVKIYTRDMRDYMVDIIEHMVNVFEPVKDIPENWTNETLEQYADEILAVTLQINSAGYYTNGNADFYNLILAKWRGDKGDYFDILYSYYLYVEEDTEFIKTKMVGSVPLPGKLEDWYASLSLAVYYETYFYKYYGTKEGMLQDTSSFMLNYFTALELAEEIKTSGNKLWCDVFAACDGDEMNHKLMYTSDFGYLYHLGGVRDSADVEALWKDYFELLKLYNKGELSAEAQGTEIKALFDSLVNLTPRELFGFLSSLNFMYGVTVHPNNVLSYGEDSSYNMFTKLLRDYYLPTLTDAVKPMFAKILLAMENYALVGHNGDAMTKFKENMAELKTAYEALTESSDEKSFDDNLLLAYSKYLDIYNLEMGTVSAEISASDEALLAELKASLDRYFALHAYMGGLKNIPSELYGILYAAYAESDAIYNEALEYISEDALPYMFWKTYSFSQGEYNLGAAFNLVASTTIKMLDNRSFGDASDKVYSAWELYKNYGMKDVFAGLAALLYYGYNPEAVELDSEYIVKAMDTVAKLNGMQYSILSYLNVASPYYEALEEYFAENLTEGGCEVADALVKAELAYRQGNTEAFDALMANVQTKYAALTNGDKSYLSGIYTYYMNIYNS